MLKRNWPSLNDSLTRTGAASRKMKKKIDSTKMIALTPLRRITASSSFSPRTAHRGRLIFCALGWNGRSS